MTTALAASTVLALAGTSHGFIVEQFAIQPNATIAPDVGLFFQNLGGYGSFANGNVITGSPYQWGPASTAIRGSTWLAGDRNGGGGVFSTATGLAAERPEWNAGNMIQLGTPVIDSAGNTFANIPGGTAGYNWTANAANSFQMPSAVSPVNGVSVDSIFFGQFVFADQSASSLVGQDLLATIDGTNHFLPLDGSPGTMEVPDGGSRGLLPSPYAIDYESFTTADGNNAVRGFIVIPTPGAMGVLGFAGFAALRRRR